ncbi:hypothetical protein GOBAR_DD16004 [Gossypium barbadense]|nr:hypothetical protein GOBAR_DD16004 [Gossypium barbadense]
MFSIVQAGLPPLVSFKLASKLEKIGSLKAQSDIVPKEIHSIDLDPSCPYQLAFHLDDGWEDVESLSKMNHQRKKNIFVPLSEGVTTCASHPLNGTIITGTKVQKVGCLSIGTRSIDHLNVASFIFARRISNTLGILRQNCIYSTPKVVRKQKNIKADFF